MFTILARARLDRAHGYCRIWQTWVVHFTEQFATKNAAFIQIYKTKKHYYYRWANKSIRTSLLNIGLVNCIFTIFLYNGWSSKVILFVIESVRIGERRNFCAMRNLSYLEMLEKSVEICCFQFFSRLCTFQCCLSLFVSTILNHKQNIYKF